MSPECRSSALTMFSRLFFDALRTMPRGQRQRQSGKQSRARSRPSGAGRSSAGLAGAGDVQQIRIFTRADPVGCRVAQVHGRRGRRVVGCPEVRKLRKELERVGRMAIASVSPGRGVVVDLQAAARDGAGSGATWRCVGGQKREPNVDRPSNGAGGVTAAFWVARGPWAATHVAGGTVIHRSPSGNADSESRAHGAAPLANHSCVTGLRV